MFLNTHRNKELQEDFNVLKSQLKGKGFAKIYESLKISVIFSETFVYRLEEKDQANYDRVLQKLEDEVRDWMDGNGYTDTYNTTLTERQRYNIAYQKQNLIEEKRNTMDQEHLEKIVRKNQRAVSYEIVKKNFPNATRNSVPIIDVEQKKLYVNSIAAAKALDPPVISSTVFEKAKNPLNWRYRHATIEEIQENLYLDSYDYLFDIALDEALNNEIVVKTDRGYQFNKEKIKERRKQKKMNHLGE